MRKDATVETMFGELIRLETAQQREDYLDRQCDGNPSLRGQLERLLAAHLNAGSFLDEGDEPTADFDGPGLEGTAIGPYILREQIGEGGMGIVYVAEQEKPLRRKVALKIIKPGMDSKAVIARFEAEQQALALMNHRNIAKVLDAGICAAGRPYFVMELVSGIPITEYCDERRLSIRERLRLFVQLCRALQHAHQKGIIHRDIKPSNVLVTEEDGAAVPKIIDFGIAKALSQKLTDRTLYTNFQAFLGTPMYASPEQASLSNVDVDTRSDVYSLGVLLYELVTGTTPFDRSLLQKAAYEEICRVIREQEPAKPSTKISTLGQTLSDVSRHRSTVPGRLVQSVRGDLDWIVMKALEKDRARRYDGASSFAADIDRLLNDDAVEARPPTAIYQFGKLIRRHRMAARIALMLFALLTIGLLRERIMSRRLQVAVERQSQTADELRQLLVEYEKDLTAQALLHVGNGQVDEARSLAKRLDSLTSTLNRTPTSIANVNFIDGLATFFGGNEQVAYEKLQVAVEESPEKVGIKAMAGLMKLYTTGDVDYERVMTQLRAVPPSSDPYDRLFYGFADLYCDPIHAAETIDEAIAAAPSAIGFAIQSVAYGHVAVQTGDDSYLDRSAASSEKASSIAPTNAWVMLAQLFLAQNEMLMHRGSADFDVARLKSQRLMSQLQQQRPEYGFGFVLRANHALLVHDWRTAADEWLNMAEQGSWLESYAPVFYQSKHRSAVLDLFRTSEDRPPSSRVTAAYLLAEEEFQKAVNLCLDEYAAYPANCSAINAANCLLFLGEKEAARELAQRALRELPSISRPHLLTRQRLQYVVDEDLDRFRETTSQTALLETRRKYLEYQQGMLALANRDQASALLHFRIVVNTEFVDAPETLWAQLFVSRWDEDPNWMPPTRSIGDGRDGE